MPITVGDKAPDFTLFNSEKQPVELSSYIGKNVVILFFPLAYTSVCTTELCNMRDNLALYNSLQAEILAISIDSPFTLAKFKEDQQLNFTLLSDFNKEVSKAYDSLYEVFPAFGMQGVSKRAAFVVDKEGVIQFIQINESPQDLPDFEAIQETLRRIN